MQERRVPNKKSLKLQEDLFKSQAITGYNSLKNKATTHHII